MSATNVSDEYESYLDCFMVANINGNLKIVGAMIFGNEDDYDNDVQNWHKRPGHDSEIDIKKLGEPIAIERYLEPKHCEFSMKDYLANK